MESFNLEQLINTYSNLLTGQYKQALSELIEGTNQSFVPPSINIQEAEIDDAAEHVRLSSDYYSKISTITGFARSAQKLTEGRYKQAFRVALLEANGSNKETREAEAAVVTSELHDQLLFFESALMLFTSLEQAARVNADSSRKIAELIHSQRITEAGNKF